MKRFGIVLAFLFGVGLTAGSVANAQDKVTYLDKAKKTQEAKGEIVEETPAKIVLKPNVTIPAADVVEAVYVDRLPLDKRGTYRKAMTAETAIDKAAAGPAKKAAIDSTIKLYQEALADVKGIKFAARHLEYKVARLTARLATEDPKERKAAIDLLLRFKKDNADSWQISGCLERLADLQASVEDYKGAAASLTELQNLKGVPDDVKATIPRKLVELLVKAKDYKEASTQLDTVLKGIKKDHPDYFALSLLKIQMDANVPGKLDGSVKQMEGIIKDTKDGAKLSVCYNALGSLYLANNRPKDALYQFLYVDLIYNENRAEQAKACAELAKLFEKGGKPSRAKEYAEKAEKLK